MREVGGSSPPSSTMEFKDLFRTPQMPEKYYRDIELRLVPAVRRTAEENGLGPSATQALGVYCMGLWYREISGDPAEPVANSTLEEIANEISS